MSWKKLINKVNQMDALELLKMIPDKSIDLVLTDPPYGIGIDGQKMSLNKNPKVNRKNHDFKGWDNKIPNKEIFKEIFRVSKNQIVFGANYFNEYLKQGCKGWIIWDKRQRGLTMSDCEIIYSSFNKATRIYTFNRCELKTDGSFHPTMKPLKLISKIIKENSEDDDIILDCFMGSWTTAVACQNLKRNFIGCELDKDYCAIGKQRLRQMTLL